MNLVERQDRVLLGGLGNDSLDGGLGRDTLAGNDGDDVLILTARDVLAIVK